jgi:hypothetical protein
VICAAEVNVVAEIITTLNILYKCYYLAARIVLPPWETRDICQACSQYREEAKRPYEM